MIFERSMFTKTKNVRVALPKAALAAVMDECDRYDADETGGRILGNFEIQGDKLLITVTGIIEPGPDAQRTATYFKQDGTYQEDVFRRVEDSDPTIEHLGNWHTHHVNGLKHLSGGDISTYRRIVEHEKHNIDFFYALLVVEKRPRKRNLDRYEYKNYIFRRGDPNIYEIPDSAVTLVDAPLVWPLTGQPSAGAGGRTQRPAVTETYSGKGAEDERLKISRVYDRDILTQFFPKVSVFMSKKLGIYWRGPIELVDGSQIEVVVLEDATRNRPEYSINVMRPPPALEAAAKSLGEGAFQSCRAALITLERTCNHALYRNS